MSTLTGFAGIDGVHDFVKTPRRGLDETSVVVTRWDKDNWIVVGWPRGQPLTP